MHPILVVGSICPYRIGQTNILLLLQTLFQFSCCERIQFAWIVEMRNIIIVLNDGNRDSLRIVFGGLSTLFHVKGFAMRGTDEIVCELLAALDFALLFKV